VKKPEIMPTDECLEKEETGNLPDGIYKVEAVLGEIGNRRNKAGPHMFLIKWTACLFTKF